MNSYTDKDMAISRFLIILALSISTSLLIVLVPYIMNHEDRLDQIEEQIRGVYEKDM